MRAGRVAGCRPRPSGSAPVAATTLGSTRGATSRPPPRHANFGNSTGETLPVGSLPAGASPYGILDLSGNVWEWTSSLEQPYPYAADDGREDPAAEGKRIARGGSFYYTQYQARCTARSGFAPTTANPNFGLRIVLPPADVHVAQAVRTVGCTSMCLGVSLRWGRMRRRRCRSRSSRRMR